VRALITGSAGFVGRHMQAELEQRGWEVNGVDIADHASNDAVDYFRRYTGYFAYDLVVHAAASAPHRNAIDHEHGHFARNVQLDAAMFDWAVRTGQKRVLYLSSSAAYPQALQDVAAGGWRLAEDDISLTDAEEPDSEYGWAKLTGERMAAAARRAGLPVTVVRPFSGYGEDQSPDFPFTAILERAKRQDRPLEIWGSGDQTRDWIHISDVVNAALAVVETGVEEPVNLCTGRGVTMRELATMAAHAVGYEPRIKALPDKPAGVLHRVGDPTRLHAYYEPKVTLEEGIERALRR